MTNKPAKRKPDLLDLFLSTVKWTCVSILILNLVRFALEAI